MTQRLPTDTAGFMSLDPVQHPQRLSNVRHGILQSHVVNGDIGNRTRRRWQLRWSPATSGQAIGVRDHFNANAHNSFVLQLPGGATANVIYVDPPRIRPRSFLASDVTVVLEEALATN